MLCGASKKAEGMRAKWKSQAGRVESAGAYQQQKFFQQPFLALPEDNEHNDALISLETGAGPQRSGGIRNVTPC